MDFSGSGVISRNVLIDNTSSPTDDAISLQGDASDASRELIIDRNYIDGAQGVVLEGWRLISPQKAHDYQQYAAQGRTRWARRCRIATAGSRHHRQECTG